MRAHAGTTSKVINEERRFEEEKGFISGSFYSFG
jgi:hypothetical protein